MSLRRQALQSQNSRGPHRSRWQRKEPPLVDSKTACVFAVFLLVACSLYHHTKLEKNITPTHPQTQRHPVLDYFPLRGHLKTIGQPKDPLLGTFQDTPIIADAIVVGSGLAGLTAALNVLDRGGVVYIIEKESFLGGNSNKASSGINGCCFQDDDQNVVASYSPATNDTLELFFQDTFRSAGDVANPDLIETLVENSAAAIQWLQERVKVDLSAPLVQLGGHSRKRTHRPSMGFVGAEIMNAMETAIRKYESKGCVRILVDHTVTKILKAPDDDRRRVLGVTVSSSNGSGKDRQNLRSDNVILATGGFAADRTAGSLLRQYRPELQNMAATAGNFSTGDGIHLAQHLGASLRDMEKIQIHPTGFVDPENPNDPQKVLAAELLRGVGGILLNREGNRFCNELGTRSYITNQMLEHDTHYKKTHVWNSVTPVPTFTILLSATAAGEAQKHVDTYIRKGLMQKVNGIHELARYLEIAETHLRKTIKTYQQSAHGVGDDAFGKIVFGNVFEDDMESQDYFVGTVTPVVHYTMGGVTIDHSGKVLDGNEEPIEGLFAIGEVTGGLHGNNRLGGNSLLECAVFGRIVGANIPIAGNIHTNEKGLRSSSKKIVPRKTWTYEQLSMHDKQEDCLVALHGHVYDLSSFIMHHPGGEKSIISLCGKDGTSIFSAAHSANILSRIESNLVGRLDESRLTKPPSPHEQMDESSLLPITRDTLEMHNTSDDCWVVIHGLVFDLGEFSVSHPGGSYIIQKMAGKDATETYSVFHSKEKLLAASTFIVGKLSK